VRISGVDRLTWLNDLTTQRLNTLSPRVGSDALILSPQGHVEHYLQLVDDGEAVWVHVEPESAPALVDFLTSMRFMLRVEVDDLTADWAVVWEPVREPHPTLVSRVDPQVDEAAGRQVFVPRADLPAFAASADRTGPPAGVLALEALRVAAGRPRFGLETDHRTIPHELGWIGSAVQLDKGCYRGQETVARVANLGRPPRRLVRLHLDGSARERGDRSSHQRGLSLRTRTDRARRDQIRDTRRRPCSRGNRRGRRAGDHGRGGRARFDPSARAGSARGLPDARRPLGVR
jgi:tRNA-modifying protein YgfZ